MIISPDDCKVISSFWDESKILDESYNKYAKLSGNNIKLKTNTAKANYVNIEDKSQLDFILSKIQHLGIKSISLNEASLMKYRKGDYFGLHKDFPDYGYDRLNRTIIVQLSDPSSYSGGELIVKGKVQPKELGSIITIKSNEVHEVTKVNSGQRLTLAIFLLNRDIKVSKSIL